MAARQYCVHRQPRQHQTRQRPGERCEDQTTRTCNMYRRSEPTSSAENKADGCIRARRTTGGRDGRCRPDVGVVVAAAADPPLEPHLAPRAPVLPHHLIAPSSRAHLRLGPSHQILSQKGARKGVQPTAAGEARAPRGSEAISRSQHIPQPPHPHTEPSFPLVHLGMYPLLPFSPRISNVVDQQVSSTCHTPCPASRMTAAPSHPTNPSSRRAVGGFTPHFVAPSRTPACGECVCSCSSGAAPPRARRRASLPRCGRHHHHADARRASKASRQASLALLVSLTLAAPHTNGPMPPSLTESRDTELSIDPPTQPPTAAPPSSPGGAPGRPSLTHQ
jgi:hypothetical protein